MLIGGKGEEISQSSPAASLSEVTSGHESSRDSPYCMDARSRSRSLNPGSSTVHDTREGEPIMPDRPETDPCKTATSFGRVLTSEAARPRRSAAGSEVRLGNTAPQVISTKQ